MGETLSKRLADVAGLFLKLGVTGFGGPAAHIAMMHDETVTRRKWLSDQEFLDLVGATNLIPGPNSTEMAIHIGFRRAGWPGLSSAGPASSCPPCSSSRHWPTSTCASVHAPGRVAAVRHQARRHRHHRPGALEPGRQGRQDPLPGGGRAGSVHTLLPHRQRDPLAVRRRGVRHGGDEPGATEEQGLEALSCRGLPPRACWRPPRPRTRLSACRCCSSRS